MTGLSGIAGVRPRDDGRGRNHVTTPERESETMYPTTMNKVFVWKVEQTSSKGWGWGVGKELSKGVNPHVTLKKNPGTLSAKSFP